MYEKTITFAIASAHPSLAQTLQEIPSLPEFTHCFKSGLSETELSSPQAEVILIDFDKTALLTALFAHKKPGTVLILLSDKPREVPEDYWQFIDDLWVVTDHLSEVKTKFKALQERFAQQRQCRLNGNLLLSVIDASPALIWFKDTKGAHVEINKKFCETVNKPREVVRGKGHYFIWDITPEDYQKGEFVCQETDVEVMEKKVAGIFDENVMLKGEMRKFKTIKAPLFDDEHQIMGTLGIANDITDVLNLSIELQTMLDRFPFGVVLIDNRNIIRNVNEKLCHLIHIQRSDAIGQPQTYIKALFFNQGWRFQDDGLELSSGDHHDEWYYERNGKQQWITVDDEELLDVFSHKIGRLILLEDVTQEHLNSQALIQQASTDLLTGLYNRRYFYKNVPLLRAKSISDGIIFIDLNRFKPLNDEYGHEAGDTALKTVAELMQEEFGELNGISIRQGGDEFVVYLRNLSLNKLTKCAEHFQRAIKDEFDESEQMRTLQASVGVAYTENHNISLDELVTAADKAMYDSKHSGGNIVRVEVLAQSRRKN